MGRRRGTLSTKADWSGIAAQAVMRKPAPQRLWMPPLASVLAVQLHARTAGALRGGGSVWGWEAAVAGRRGGRRLRGRLRLSEPPLVFNVTACA
jgi:hypothetical protein